MKPPKATQLRLLPDVQNAQKDVHEEGAGRTEK